MPTPNPMSLTMARVLPLFAALTPAELQVEPTQSSFTVLFFPNTKMPVTEPTAMPAMPMPPIT